MFTNPGGSFSNPLTSLAYGFWPSSGGGSGFNFNQAIDSLIGATFAGLQAGGVIDMSQSGVSQQGYPVFDTTGDHIPDASGYPSGGQVLPPTGFCQSVTRQTAPGVRMKKVVQVMKPNGEMTNYIHAGTAKTFSLASFKSRRKRCCPR